MSKDQTEVGITGKPIPKPRTAKQQYELEKKRRMQKHLGTNVGGKQYTSGAKYYVPSTSATNPRTRTFEEFMSICEARVPVTRQAGDFRYSGRTGEEKAERRARVLSNSPDPKKRRQANTIRSRIKTVADRDTARASSDARQKLYRGQQLRANELAQQLMSKEEVELDEVVVTRSPEVKKRAQNIKKIRDKKEVLAALMKHAKLQKQGLADEVEYDV